MDLEGRISLMTRVQIIDSHTGGEPIRVVISGGPELGGGTVADKLKVLRAQHDRFRSAVVNEPRGSDVLVGALLVEAPARHGLSDASTSSAPTRTSATSACAGTEPLD